MPETRRGERPSWRRFQVMLFLSAAVPCALLGYLAVHVLQYREAQMRDMARSRTLATAQMAASAAEEAIRARVDGFLMSAVKLDLGPSVSLDDALGRYLADRPMVVATFVFGPDGRTLGSAVSPRGETPRAPGRGSLLAERTYARVRLGRRESRAGFFRERMGKVEVLVAHSSLGDPPGPASRLLAVALDADWLRKEVVEPVLRERAKATGLTVRRSEGNRSGAHEGPAAEARFSGDFPVGVVEVSGAEEALREARNRDRLLLGAGLALVYGVVAGGFLFSWRALRREWELTRLKSAFMANVSHELRTPLALIRMYAESLLLGRVSEEAKRAEYHQVLAREADRLTRLTNNILDFSDIESGRKKYDFRRASLADVVRRVLTDYGPHLQQAGARLRSAIADDLPERPLDEAALTQALLNLLDNAVKYSPERPEIDVRVYTDGDLVLAVEDRGPGIPPEARERIFEPFHRTNPGIAPRGSGLGLALVRHVVEAHGGTVRAEAAPGGGSRFVIRLPRQGEAAP